MWSRREGKRTRQHAADDVARKTTFFATRLQIDICSELSTCGSRVGISLVGFVGEYLLSFRGNICSEPGKNICIQRARSFDRYMHVLQLSSRATGKSNYSLCRLAQSSCSSVTVPDV